MMEQLQRDFKISLESSAAVVGNGGAESGGFQSLQEKKPLIPGSRGGFGVFQWTGPRRRLFEAYCSRNKLDPTAMETNYKFLFVELKGSEGKDGKVLQRVEAAKTLEAKTEVFMKEFLRPGIPHLDSRITWAKRAMAAWSLYKPEKPAEATPSVPTVPEPEAPKDYVPVIPEAKKGIWELILEILLKLLRK
jgi:hypothetical protein